MLSQLFWDSRVSFRAADIRKCGWVFTGRIDPSCKASRRNSFDLVSVTLRRSHALMILRWRYFICMSLMIQRIDWCSFFAAIRPCFLLHLSLSFFYIELWFCLLSSKVLPWCPCQIRLASVLLQPLKSGSVSIMRPPLGVECVLICHARLFL